MPQHCAQHRPATSLRHRKRAEELYLTAIVQTSDDAIIGKTLDGTIVSWNRGAEKMYGSKRRRSWGIQ